MQLLVCGMHRSGTSAVARLLAKGCDRTLLDDPEWAIRQDQSPTPANGTAQLEAHEIVKCPRMVESLDAVFDLHPSARAVVMVRDPRDVWCSIWEKTCTGRSTRMLSYRRLGVEGVGLPAFTAAYAIYCALTAQALLDHAEKLTILRYEDFFENRVVTVAGLADTMEWTFSQGAVVGLEHEQLGPPANKATGDAAIRGPERWRTDLHPREAAQFDDALRARADLFGIAIGH